MKREITVAEWSVPALESAVKKLIRTAKKIDAEPLPSLEVDYGSRREIPQTHEIIIKDGSETLSDECSKRVVPVVDCTITLPDFGLRVQGNWRVAAVIEKIGDSKENELFCDPADLPKVRQYRSCGTECEHCKTHRARVQMLIVEERATGRLMQVGKECAELYVGDRVDSQVRTLAFQDLIVQVLRPFEEVDAEGHYNGTKALAAWDSEEVMAHAFACARTRGWEPTSEKLDYRTVVNPTATAFYVMGVLKVPDTMAIKADPAKPPYFVTEVDHDAARAAMRWLQDQPADPEQDEYLAKLQAAFEPDWISEKRMRFSISLVRAYTRAQEQVEFQRLAAKSQYVGTAGQRGEFTLTLLSATPYSNQWGGGVAYRMRDKDDNVFSWLTSGGCGFPQDGIGKTFRVKGTIKNHEEYRGSKTTGLSRAIVIGEEAVVAAAEQSKPNKRASRAKVKQTADNPDEGAEESESGIKL